jgi:hypothetical protein
MGRGWSFGERSATADRLGDPPAQAGGQTGDRRRRISRRFLSIAVATAVTALTIGAGSALAAQQVISTPGPINNIWLSDDLACQATHVGDTANEFYGGTNPGGCGTMLATGGTAYGPTTNSPGFSGTDFSPISQSPILGSGAASDPYRVVTTVHAGTTGIALQQTDSYVVGQEQYRTAIVVTNTNPFGVLATLYHAGDCYLQGSDSGFGAVDSVNSAILCTANANNSPPGRIVGFQALTPGANYQEGGYSTVWSGITSNGTQFPNTCDCTTFEDNGAGLSWPVALPPGASATYSLNTVMSPAGAVGAPPPTGPTTTKPVVNTGAASAPNSTSASFSGSVNPGGLQTTAVFQYGLDPSYAGGGPVNYTNQVAASPSPVGSDSSLHQVTGSAGGLVPNAKYHYRLVATNSLGTTYGSDQTIATTQGPPPPNPVLGKSFNMRATSGIMYVKFPGSESGGALTSTGPGFVPCLVTCHLPAGTQIDSRYGKFTVQSASGRKGQLFSGTFGGAIVQVSQANAGSDKGLTTFRLLLGAFPGAPNLKGCSTKASRAQASGGPVAQIASISSVYHSRSRGRYRTRYGRASGSSLGTQWDTIVSCAGVRFKVFKDTVVVNDSARHKIVSVTAGHSYLAKR